MSYKKVVVSALALAMSCGPALADGTVNVLTWEGYADQSFISKFEKESGCKVNATYVGSGEEIIAKLAAGGGVYDLVSPASDISGTIIDADFVEPLDTSKIPEWNNIFEKFRQLPSIQKDGKYYAMPYTWGVIGFMYRNSAFPTPPTSIKELFNESHKGRVSLWDDKSAIYVAARANGDMNIYTLDDQQLQKAVDTLVKQRPLIRKYWATAGELVDLYANNEVDISNTWTGYIANTLKGKGVEVTEFIPKENAEAWADTWMVVKGRSSNSCTYKFLNMQLSELGQCGVSEAMQYSVSNPVAAKKCLSEAAFKDRHMDDPTYLDGLMLWQPLGERLEAYTNAWNSVKAQ